MDTAVKPSSLNDLSVGMALQGTVKRIELYGAFVDIGIGTDGLLHISQLGQPNVRNVEDVVKTGDTITVYVLKIDPETRRIALSLGRPPAVSWDTLAEGSVVTGKISRLEKFGAFVDIGAERDGMIHVSELANGYVNAPEDVVKVGDEITARVIAVNRKKKRIDLSLKAMTAPAEGAAPSGERTSGERPARGERSSDRPARSSGGGGERGGDRGERGDRGQGRSAVAQYAMDQQAEAEPVPTAMELALRRAQEAPVVSGDEVPGEERESRKRGNKRDKRDRQREYEEIYERTLRGNR